MDVEPLALNGFFETPGMSQAPKHTHLAEKKRIVALTGRVFAWSPHKRLTALSFGRRFLRKVCYLLGFFKDKGLRAQNTGSSIKTRLFLYPVSFCAIAKVQLFTVDILSETPDDFVPVFGFKRLCEYTAVLNDAL